MTTTPENSDLTLTAIDGVLREYGLLKSKSSLESVTQSRYSFSPDSRKAGPNCGFIAYRGVASDGHKFLDQAVQKQAAFIICEQANFSNNHAVPTFVVTNGRAAWSVLESLRAGHPQRQMCMLGVTGTNGKSSTAWMVRQLLRNVDESVLMVGTLGAYLNDEFVETKHTTPDPDMFYPLLKKAVSAGIRTCIMEVSSHAIAQEKLTPVTFDAVGFTSFTRDHLDFHKDEKDYWETKCRLFGSMTKSKGQQFYCSVLTQPPPAGKDCDLWSYGIEGAHGKHPDVAIKIESETLHGSEIVITDQHKSLHRGSVPYFGAHALENLCLAISLAATVSKKAWNPDSWRQLSQVPGRLELVPMSTGPAVFVDYAHTPDALEKTLAFLQKYRKGKLTVVFGCGGDRDRGKRPQMGKIAYTYADRIYITSDNPRSESPEQIVSDIAAGVTDQTSTQIVVDRRAAIERAINDSEDEDIIVIAGKGHETYQIIGDKVLSFDDRLVAKDVLTQRKR